MTHPILVPRGGKRLDGDPYGNPSITFQEQEEALAMWADGFDTYDISQALNIHESHVYNRLPRWRKLTNDHL